MALFDRFRKRTKSALASSEIADSGRGFWRSIIRESFTGAWQRNKELHVHDLTGYHAVFACITLIASDICKMSMRHSKQSSDGVWTPDNASKWSKLLQKPNDYQTMQQFIEAWVISKMARGNTYVLMEPGGVDGLPRALHVLNPDLVMPRVSPKGYVFYSVSQQRLAHIEEGSLLFAAEDIMHDRFNCLYHPLVGVSPIYAAAAAVLQGREIQQNSATFFGNNSMPGGVLTVPGAIDDETALRLKTTWEETHSGLRQGKLAVLSDGMEYKPVSLTATDSQLLEQLRWTAEVACSVYHVPPYKIGVGALPSYNNIDSLNREYYSQCLQRLIIDMQSLLNTGLEVPVGTSYRADLDALLLMDVAAQMTVLKDGVAGGIFEPNYARKKFNLPPVKGGEVPYLQQQNWSLSTLSERPPPTAATGKATTVIPTDPTPVDPQAVEQRDIVAAWYLEKELAQVKYG